MRFGAAGYFFMYFPGAFCLSAESTRQPAARNEHGKENTAATWPAKTNVSGDNMHSRTIAAALGVCGVLLFSGCASIVSGVSQPISVESRVDGVSVAGAACKLSSNKGTWFVTTPGSLTVHRGFQDIAVECTRPGLESSLTMVPSHVRAIAFGNILFGGLIGVIVDSGDGAAFDYPDLFTIDMKAAATGVRPAPEVAASVNPYGPAEPSIAPPARPAPAMVGVQEPQPPKPVVAASIDRSEHRYQLSAESFAVQQSCVTRPASSTFAGRGPAYEIYGFTCRTGEPLLVRCEYGICRAVQ